MSKEKFYKKFVLREDMQELEQKLDYNPYYAKISSGLSDPLIINGEEYVNLAANNYLGLAMNPKVMEHAKKAMDRYGISLCGTPIATGSIDLYQRMQKRLANFVGVEDVIILPSCYQANNAIFMAILTAHDVVIVDHYAHSSLSEGIKATKCKIRPFKHNDLQSLEKNLKVSASNLDEKGHIFVVTESVFSTEGSIAPFAEMVKLCEKYDAIPLIDDSHGIGVLGKNGNGILSHFGLDKGNYSGIYTTSTGKALATVGGIIGGPKKFIEYLKYYCSHLVYSTAISPINLGALEMILNILEDDSEYKKISDQMWRYRNMLADGLKAVGFKLADGPAPIVSIKAGDSIETLLLAKAFYKQKILTTPFIFPSVPLDGGVVRLIAMTTLKEETIERVLGVLNEVFIDHESWVKGWKK
ncbi:MAG: pyridoxal phosphate-dependent aminotransferase family protein [Oligoflexia bacterium]|nr:pyridoxal phosphate-dependent aminotransferase family protein [Oligoflexia bacterium]